ncbi:MAG: hypothetical protein SGPRY_011518, partial [Prymnesium sp.]
GIDAPGLWDQGDDVTHAVGAALVLCSAALALSGRCRQVLMLACPPPSRLYGLLSEASHRNATHPMLAQNHSTTVKGERLVEAHLTSLGDEVEMTRCGGTLPISPAIHSDAMDDGVE